MSKVFDWADVKKDEEIDRKLNPAVKYKYSKADLGRFRSCLAGAIGNQKFLNFKPQALRKLEKEYTELSRIMRRR